MTTTVVHISTSTATVFVKEITTDTAVSITTATDLSTTVLSATATTTSTTTAAASTSTITITVPYTVNDDEMTSIESTASVTLAVSASPTVVKLDDDAIALSAGLPMSKCTPHQQYVGNTCMWVIIGVFIGACVLALLLASCSKLALVWVGSILAIVGAILTATSANDSDACVNLRNASILGTVLTALGIILSAFASL